MDLKEHGIVPDVLSADGPTNIAELVKISYGNVEITPGVEITPSQSNQKPNVSWKSDPNKFYTLFMTDPDAPSKEDPSFREFIHWIVTDIPGSDVKSGVVLMDYLGPAPPHASGLHRYCFLVYGQKEKGVVNVDEAKKMFEGRGGKQIKNLMGMGDLIAANLMMSQWGKECDGYHEGMGWVPPEKYRSPTQQTKSLTPTATRTTTTTTTTMTTTTTTTTRPKNTRPEQHELERFTTKTSSYECDVCKNKLLIGTDMYGCKTSNWNCCLACFKIIFTKKRTKIALVGSNVSELKDGEEVKAKTGSWSEEITTPYYVFTNGGYNVDLYSVKGGKIIIDETSLNPDNKKKSDDRFLADAEAMNKIDNSLPLNTLKVEDYDMIFFAGGHGPLVDYLEDDVKNVVETFWNEGKVIAAVCHGSICFANASFLPGKNITSFSMEEDKIVGMYCPIICETILTERGARYSKGPSWMPYVIQHEGLITGQNPASSKKCAEDALALTNKWRSNVSVRSLQTKLVLHYFGVKARCFNLPIAAAYLGRTDFKWEKYSHEDWGSNKNDIKSKCAFGQLPVLVDGDYNVSQSMAIARHVAKEWKLEGNDMQEYGMCQQLIEESNDLFGILVAAKYHPPNPDTYQQWLENFKILPKHFSNLEKLLSDGKFTSTRTMGDFCIFQMLHFILDADPKALDDFLALKNWYTSIFDNENVKALCSNTPIWFKAPKKPCVLHYFDIKARCFNLPIAAAYLGRTDLKWEKYSFEDWGSDKNDIKSKCAFGQLPILIDGNRNVCQSMAITRYLAKKWNLEGDGLKEFSICQQLIEESNDLFKILIAAKYHPPNPNTRQQWSEKFKTLPKHFANLEKLLSDGKFTSARTMGDFCIFQLLHFILGTDPKALDDFQALKNWYSLIFDNENVKAVCSNTPTWMTAPAETYVLHYFGVKARCFNLPIAAAYLGRNDFKWEQYSFEDWKSNKNDIKSKCAFGQLPVLSDSDRNVSQSLAITRYIAHKWNLEGNGSKDYGMSEQLIEESNDLNKILQAAKYHPPNPDTRQQWLEKLKTLPKHFANLEKLLSDGKFTSVRTMGEFCIFQILNIILDADPKALDTFQALKNWYTSIFDNENVKAICNNTPIYFKVPEDP